MAAWYTHAGWLDDSAGRTVAAGASSPSGSSKHVAAPAGMLPTDMLCKAQRQVLDDHLRAGEVRLAHCCSASAAVHSKAINLVASAAAGAGGSALLGGAKAAAVKRTVGS